MSIKRNECKHSVARFEVPKQPGNGIALMTVSFKISTNIYLTGLNVFVLPGEKQLLKAKLSKVNRQGISLFDGCLENKSDCEAVALQLHSHCKLDEGLEHTITICSTVSESMIMNSDYEVVNEHITQGKDLYGRKVKNVKFYDIRVTRNSTRIKVPEFCFYV